MSKIPSAFEQVMAVREPLLEKIRELEFEIMRIKTHENRAAVELDSMLDDEERKTFSSTCDELAKTKRELNDTASCLYNMFFQFAGESGKDEEGRNIYCSDAATKDAGECLIERGYLERARGGCGRMQFYRDRSPA